MSRRNSRKSIIQLLYSYEFDADQKPSLLSLKKLNAADQDFVLKQIECLKENKNTLDKVIKKHTKNWKTERMSLVDLNIMRLAVFEILFCEDIPDKSALNEALELAKTYGDKSSPAFVNGILDQVLEEKNREFKQFQPCLNRSIFIISLRKALKFGVFSMSLSAVYLKLSTGRLIF